MKNFRKLIGGFAASAGLMSVICLQASAATVDLPAEFADLTPIFEFVLKIVELLSGIISFFA